MKRWRKALLILECLHLAIQCAQELKKFLKRKKEKEAQGRKAEGEEDEDTT